MMSIGSPRKMWYLIGAAGSVAIVALGYVLLISGVKSDQASTESQIADTQAQIARDQKAIDRQRADNAKLPSYRAQLSKLNAALPHSSSTSQFLSDLHKVEKAADVEITGQTFTQPTTTGTTTGTPSGTAPASDGGSESSSTPATPNTAPVAAVSELPVNITVQGKHADLQRFLDMLQRTMARAVVVDQVTETAPVGGSGADKAVPSLAITMKAFVAAS